MAHFDCVVDTRPMAREIESVSHKINNTTAAVVAMQAAVIKAEEDAANLVCNNVNRGFHALIHSQISQKIAHLQSDVDSHLMKLNQHCKQLVAIKDRMQRDYNMLKSRYTKLFNGINKNLQIRVYELDKPTINLAVRDSSTMSNRTLQLTATVPVSQVEMLATSQRILASNIKNRCAKVVESINGFLTQIQEQDKLSERILLPVSVSNDVTPIMVPIIISESNYDAFNHINRTVTVNEDTLTSRGADAIRKGVFATTMEWVDNTDINDEIRSEFHRCMEQSTASDRVKAMAQRLFLANSFQTLK